MYEKNEQFLENISEREILKTIERRKEVTPWSALVWLR